MNVSEAIRGKRAVRRFQDRPLPDDALRAILHAGRRSQSSKNSQPWHFVVVRRRETLKALSKLGDYAGHLAGAAAAIALVSPEPANPEAARHWWAGFDIGQCAAYLQLAAVEHGIGSCIATMYRPDEAARLLGVPAGLACHLALSLGYPQEEESAAERKPSARGRRSLEDVVHWEAW